MVCKPVLTLELIRVHEGFQRNSELHEFPFAFAFVVIIIMVIIIIIIIVGKCEDFCRGAVDFETVQNHLAQAASKVRQTA